VAGKSTKTVLQVFDATQPGFELRLPTAATLIPLYHLVGGRRTQPLASDSLAHNLPS